MHGHQQYPSTHPTSPALLPTWPPPAPLQDPSSQLLWWVLIICDPSISTPGPEEAASTGSKKWWPRDRNVRLPWSALEAALTQAVALGGDRQRYKEQYHRTKRNIFTVGPRGVLSQNGTRCPPAP